MNLTKDEAIILASALEIAIHEFKYPSGGFEKLEALQKRLEEFGKESRSIEKTSLDDFTDCMNRFVKS